MQQLQTPFKKASFLKTHTANLKKFLSFLTAFTIKALILSVIMAIWLLIDAVINIDQRAIFAIFCSLPAFILYRHTSFDSSVDRYFGITHIPSVSTENIKSDFYKRLQLLRDKNPTERLSSDLAIKEGWNQKFFGAEPEQLDATGCCEKKYNKRNEP